MDFVCTLYEKHYDYGVSVLCNSLAKCGFKGQIIIGYKLKLPFWIKQLKKTKDDEYFLNDDIQLTFICLDEVNYHLGYYKSKFILYCLDHYPSLITVSYFDPDITVKATWAFFKKWINEGVALASDNCYPFLHINHPWRKDWKMLFPEKKIISSPEFYVNSGFIGLRNSDRELLELWDEAINFYQNKQGDVNSFERDAESGLKGDQDLLNAALMFFPYDRLSVIGKEAMGFVQPSYIMGHAINGTKPWKRRFTFDLLCKNISPSFAEKLYFENSTYPIKVFSNTKRSLKIIDIKLAAALNRFL